MLIVISVECLYHTLLGPYCLSHKIKLEPRFILGAQPAHATDKEFASLCKPHASLFHSLKNLKSLEEHDEVVYLFLHCLTVCDWLSVLVCTIAIMPSYFTRAVLVPSQFF